MLLLAVKHSKVEQELPWKTLTLQPRRRHSWS